jgi:hypothetical protein
MAQITARPLESGAQSPQEIVDYYQTLSHEAPTPDPKIPTTTPSGLGTTTFVDETPPPVLGTITIVGPPLPEEPVEPAGTVMIPSIGVNSPIAFDISVSNKEAYNKALETGVAHALGTGKPDAELANTYLFAHSTADERNIARYAAVFTKLQQLELGARITIFYQGNRYDYEIVQEDRDLTQPY